MTGENETSPQNDKEDVRILLQTSLDEQEAHLTLKPLVESPEISSDSIRAVLSEKGILFGIKDDLLTLLETEPCYNERILIAEGIKPVKGIDGKIRYSVSVDGTQKVKIGDNLGQIIPPENGVEGITIFDTKTIVAEVKAVDMPKLINVELQGNENILVAGINGYFSIDDSSVKVTPFFNLTVSNDKNQAFVTVVKPLHSDDITLEDLRTYLQESGIVYGVIEQELNAIFTQGKFDRPVLIAHGKEVVDDKDGKIVYLFDLMHKADADDEGNIDYKELQLIHNVLPGEKLAKTLPVVPGVAGTNVYGEEVSSKIGTLPPLPMGNNTKPDPTDSTVLISDIEGCINIKGSLVEVDSLFVVNENVDYSTGNINFSGSLVINGDVKSGFKVKVKNDVQINGVVEDSFIEAGGNVLLKNGFLGNKKGRIVAHGTVTAKFCDHATIIADDDIHISDYVMNSTIQTKGHLYVKDKTGLIVGGNSYAIKGIDANIVGNKNENMTKLYAGVDMVTKAQIQINNEHIDNINKILQKIFRRKLVKKSIPESMTDKINRLKQLVTEKEGENRLLSYYSEKVDNNAEDLKKAIIKINKKVFPGTSITIYKNHLYVTILGGEKLYTIVDDLINTGED